MNPLQLFRTGMDYISIASHLNTTEAEVERQIHRLRRIERIQHYLAARAKRAVAKVLPVKRGRQKQSKEYKQMQNAFIRARLREIREAHAR